MWIWGIGGLFLGNKSGRNGEGRRRGIRGYFGLILNVESVAFFIPNPRLMSPYAVSQDVLRRWR